METMITELDCGPIGKHPLEVEWVQRGNKKVIKYLWLLLPRGSIINLQDCIQQDALDAIQAELDART